ncbi:MAG: insulinase family protein [Opitutaceae bacterium]|nr:insulinase family protein [Opitutaceae bacterium]
MASVLRLPALLLVVCALGALRLLGDIPAWPPADSDISTDPALVSGRLDNGLVYAVLANKEPRERASVRLYVRAGSLDETDEERGLAHYLEHMAFNGTRHFPADTLVEYFQRQGMSFGADTNASTGFDRTIYMLELPKGDSASLAEGLTVLRDFADGMLIEESEVEKERGIIFAEKRARDSVEFRTTLAEYAFVLPEVRLTSRWPIGVTETLEAADAARLRAFYERWYRPENMALVIVGEIDTEAAVGLIRDAFGSMTAAVPAAARADRGRVVPLVEPSAAVHAEAEATTVNVTIQVISPWQELPDTAANRVREMPLQVASAIINRRLDELARKDGAPFTGGGTSAGPGDDVFRVASIELTGAPDRWRDSLALAEQELRRALEHGFSAAEVREITANIINSYEEAVRSAPTRRSSGLASSLVGAIDEGNVFNTPATSLALVRPAAESVTPEACLAALREAWAVAAPHLFVSGRLGPEVTAATVLEAYLASTQVPVSAPAERAEEAFAYTDFGRPGEIVERRHIEDLDITQVRFANDVRLNLKRTDYQANSILVRARLGGGQLELSRDRPELAVVAGPLVAGSGLGRHTIEDLRRLLAGHSVGVGFAVGDDAIEYSGGTSPKDLELQLQLLCAKITDPGLRDDALARVRRSFEQQYARLRHLPAGVAQVHIPPLLASGDPRFGIPPLERMLDVTPGDVRTWLAPIITDGALEVAIVGEIDIDATIELARRTLGALPPRRPKPSFAEARQVAYPAEAPVREFTVETAIKKALVLTYWPTDDNSDIGRTRRLTVLSNVFEDRLRKVIREELAAAYSPSCGSNCSPTYDGYGLFSVSIEVDPAQAATIQAAVLRIADELRADGATEDEVTRAKEPILTSIKQSSRQNGYWIGSVLGRAQEKPEDLDNARTRAADFAAITKAEVDTLAARYLDNTRAARFIITPSETSPVPPAAAASSPASPSQP